MVDNIKQESLRGAGWSFADNISKLGVSFVVGIIMARLLTPKIYGVVGIVYIFISLFETFVDGGLSTALIRKTDATDEDYSTIFIANIFNAVFLYLLLFLGAPIIASFFNSEELVILLRVVGLTIIIGSLSLIQKTVLTKKIDFKTQTKTTFIASIISGIVGIIAALAGFGVWALVAQSLTSCILITILLWQFNKWWPKLFFSWNSFKELFGFGWKLMIIGLLSTLWNNIYNFVIVKFYAPETLGLYNRAKQFSDLGSTNITNVVQRVSLPVLSKMQDDNERMKSIYRKSIKLISFVTFNLLFGLAGVSKPLIYILLGEKWMEAATYLPLIVGNVLLIPIGTINLNMLAIKGRSDLCLYIEIIKKGFAIIPILIGVFYNFKLMLVVSIIVSTLSYFINSYYSKKIIDYSIWNQLRDVMPSFFISLTMFIVVFSLEFYKISYYVLLPTQIVIGISCIIILSKLFKISEYDEFVDVIKIFVKKISKN